LRDQHSVRMIKEPLNNMPPETYVCWDHYLSLNPFKFCQWKGLFAQGTRTYQWFDQDIAAMKFQNIQLKKLTWSNELATAASDYLKDIEGCRALPDQIFDDKP